MFIEVKLNILVSNHETTLTTDNFTFMRRAIGVAEGEVIRHASAARGKTTFNSTPKSRDSTPKVVREVKRLTKVPVYVDDVHDDNDGQYDKPEVVIERDADDYVSHFIASEFSRKSKSPSIKREAKDSGGIEKVEMIHPSMEQVIVLPKKKSQKPTARKSTSQKSFRKA